MNTRYSELLKDPRWQKLRLEIFERDKWKCQSCGSAENTLAVHHRSYMRGLKPWEYETFLLVTLCEECHASERQHLADAKSSLLAAIDESIIGSWELSWLESIVNCCEMVGDFRHTFQLFKALEGYLQNEDEKIDIEEMG
jgi:hypothetical protein